eukprot:jgi/Orpsp1_1/1183727/evm.model.c7180000086468.1
MAPETEIEKTICKIYSEILNIPANEIGRMSDFNELGGDSLSAIRTVAEIKSRLKVKLYIKDIMNNSKVYSLANLCSTLMESHDTPTKVTSIKKYNKEEYPFSYISSSVVVEEELTLESIRHSNKNIILYYELMNDLNMDKLEDAFNTIIKRHSILRTRFIEKEEENGKKQIYGKIDNDKHLSIEHFSKDNFEDLEQSIDLTKDSLIRVAIIENQVLMIKVNHCICDGYSYGILINELAKLYNGEVLEELPIQFSDYAIYYDERIKSGDFAEEIEYYKSIFNVPYQMVNLSKKSSKNLVGYEDDHSRKKCSRRFKEIKVTCDEAVYRTVKQIIKENNLSPTNYFILMMSLVLSIYSGQRNIFMEVTSSSRNEAYTENLVGMFVKVLPVLIKLDGDIQLIDLIINYKDVLLTLLSYDIPPKVLWEELSIKSSNIQFKYDPYDLFSKDDSNFLKHISRYELCEKLGRNDALLNEYEISHNQNTDMFVTISERENFFELSVEYDRSIYDESLIINIVNTFNSIVMNKNYLNENVNYIIENINNSSINKDERHKNNHIDIIDDDTIKNKKKDINSEKDAIHITNDDNTYNNKENENTENIEKHDITENETDNNNDTYNNKENDNTENIEKYDITENETDNNNDTYNDKENENTENIEKYDITENETDNNNDTYNNKENDNTENIEKYDITENETDNNNETYSNKESENTEKFEITENETDNTIVTKTQNKLSDSNHKKSNIFKRKQKKIKRRFNKLISKMICY